MTEFNHELGKELYLELKQEAKSKIEEWKSLTPGAQIKKLEKYDKEFRQMLADIKQQTNCNYDAAWVGLYGLASIISNRINKITAKPAPDPDEWEEDDEPGEVNLDWEPKENSKYSKEEQIWFQTKTNCYDCLPQGAGVNPDEVDTIKGKADIIKHAREMDKQFEEEAGMSIENFIKKHPTFRSFAKMAKTRYVDKRSGGKLALTKEEKIIRMVEDADKFMVAEKGIGQIFWGLGDGSIEFIDKRFESKHLNIFDLVAKRISNEGWIKKLVAGEKLPVCNVGLSGEEIEQMIDNFDELSAKDRAMFFPEFIVLTENDIRKCQRGNPTSKNIDKTVHELMTIAIKIYAPPKVFFDNGWQPVSIAGNFCSSVMVARKNNRYAKYMSKRKRRGRGRGYENVYVLSFNTRWAAYFFNSLLNAQANILPVEFWKELSPGANIIARMLILYTQRTLRLKVVTKALGWSEETNAHWRVNRTETLLKELKDKGCIVKNFSKAKHKKQGTAEDTYWEVWIHTKSAFKTMKKLTV